jgi:hypothetical protein
MNRERVRVRLREVLGERAAELDPLLRESGADTLAVASRAVADAERALAGAAGSERTALLDRLLAVRVLEETVAWDAMGPNTSLPEDPTPIEVVEAMRAADVLALTVRALRDCGSLVVEAGDARVVLPPLAAGTRVALDLPAVVPPPEVHVLRGEQRWALRIGDARAT